MTRPERHFVSRGGDKLAAALDAFGLDPTGRACADLGANVGGFTDCLLQRGAARVHAVDTGYGDLAWTLRKDPRVVVHERTNALHFDPPAPVDLVVLDLAWTPLSRGVPAGCRWLNGSADPLGLVALLKPHYELTKLAGRKPRKALTPGESGEVCREVCRRLSEQGLTVAGEIASPLRGKGGNREVLVHILPPGADAASAG